MVRHQSCVDFARFKVMELNWNVQTQFPMYSQFPVLLNLGMYQIFKNLFSAHVLFHIDCRIAEKQKSFNCCNNSSQILKHLWFWTIEDLYKGIFGKMSWLWKLYNFSTKESFRIRKEYWLQYEIAAHFRNFLYVSRASVCFHRRDIALV